MQIVTKLEESRTPAALGVLFSRFAQEPGDIMERLIHGVESYPAKLYVDVLARELLPLWARAPEWISTLHIRIVQSPHNLEAYVLTLRSAGPELRAAFVAVTSDVVTRRPDLTNVVAAARRAVERREPLGRRRRKQRTGVAEDAHGEPTFYAYVPPRRSRSKKPRRSRSKKR
jgi:hypothetical protein